MRIYSHLNNKAKFLFTSLSQICRCQQTYGETKIQDNNTLGRYYHTDNIVSCYDMDQTCKFEILSAITYSILPGIGPDVDYHFCDEREDAPWQDYQFHDSFYQGTDE